MNIPKLLLSVVFFLMAGAGLAQTTLQEAKDKVELVNADALEGGDFNGVEIRKLLGNVVLKQKDTFLHCDSAYQYTNRNVIEAFSNVRITQSDTLTITGNTASYDGDKRLATIRGNVFMQDPRMTLTTPSLDYDLEKKQAFYTEGGVILEGENRLESRTGTYNTVSKLFTFQGDVKLTNPDNTITSENLQYNTLSKMVFFQGPTTIKGKQGDLYAESGDHNTVTKVSNFRKNAVIETESYRLGGDVLYYDENTQYGSASQNVRMVSKKDDVVITGETAHYWRELSRAKVYGSPVMRNIVSGDTLYLSADTLVSQEANADNLKGMIHAYHDVKIYKSDLQGRCDSLTYNLTDSIVYFHHTPALWSNNSQLMADRIEMRMRNNQLHTMNMYSNSFMISEDSLQNFNQIKGRDMVAYFADNKIRRLTVNGNGESAYYALTDGDSTAMGMNKTLCSDMILKFGEDNQLQTTAFLTNVDANFFPPHELKEEDKRLKGFAWRIEEKPELKDVLAKRNPAPPKAKPAAAKMEKPAKSPKKKTSKAAAKQKSVATAK